MTSLLKVALKSLTGSRPRDHMVEAGRLQLLDEQPLTRQHLWNGDIPIRQDNVDLVQHGQPRHLRTDSV